MTREERQSIQELDALVREYERRHRDHKLIYYNAGAKVHAKQLVFHQRPERIRAMLGGNRTGKTECGAVEAVYHARGCHPYRNNAYPTEGWIVSLTNEVQRDVAQDKVLGYIDPAWIVDVAMRDGRKDDYRHGIIDYILIRHTSGGVSKIGFKSCEQGRQKFQGTSLDWVWFDEEPPKEIWDECQMRVLDKKGDMWLTMTPLMGLTWVYDQIYLNERQDPQIWCGSMQWEDNPWLSMEEIQRLNASLTEEEREARQYGRFVAMSGLVYKEFHEELHVIDPFPLPYEWQDTISIDPGLEHPLSCHFYACDQDGTVYVVEEHCQSGWRVDQHAAAIWEIARRLDWKTNAAGHLEGIIDGAGMQKVLQAEHSVVELFYAQGIDLIPTTREEKEVWGGIQRVKAQLALRPANDEAAWPKGRPGLFVFRNCPQMIKEFKSYRWKPGSDSQVEKLGDDAMDDLRYYMSRRPRPYTPERLVTPQQAHKAEMIRRLNRKGGTHRWY